MERLTDLLPVCVLEGKLLRGLVEDLEAQALQEVAMSILK
jgi:hypothetical protein